MNSTSPGRLNIINKSFRMSEIRSEVTEEYEAGACVFLEKSNFLRREVLLISSSAVVTV